MSSQRTLDFDGRDGLAVETKPLNNAQKFAKFDAANPKVWTEIVRLCEQRLADGFRRWGMQAVFEHIRWHMDIRTTGEPFKLNNTHAPFYVRKLQTHHPRLGELFRTKGQQDQ